MRKSEIGLLEMNSQLAAEILNQFGGKSFFYMVGGKDLCINDDNCLQFKIGRNSAAVNTVFVGLRADDTYYLKFSRVWWSNKDFDTIQEAVAAAGKWGFIVDTTTDEDITIKAKEGTYNE